MLYWKVCSNRIAAVYHHVTSPHGMCVQESKVTHTSLFFSPKKCCRLCQGQAHYEDQDRLWCGKFNTVLPHDSASSTLSPLQEFETNGTYDVERGRTTGNLKTKMKFPTHGGHYIEFQAPSFWLMASLGVTFSESWNTNSELDTELTYEPSAVEGLKLTLNSAFLPSSG